MQANRKTQTDRREREKKRERERKREIVIVCLVKQLTIVLTEHGECEQQVLEERREAAATFVPGPGL